MRKFLVKDDIGFLDITVFKKGETVTVEKQVDITKGGMSFSLPLEQILADPRFEEIPKIEFDTVEIPDDYEEIKNFRIQLEVKTTRSKLLQVERKIREFLEDFL